MHSIETARTALRNGDAAAAREAAAALLARDPDDLDALEVAALAAAALGDAPGAEQLLRRAIAHDPCARWASDDLARLLIGAGRRAEAEDVARASIAADPQHADAHALLGALLSERAVLPEGEHHLREAVRLAGRHPQLLVNLARNLMGQGRLDEADALARDGCRLLPGDLAAAALVAEIAEQAGQLDRADAALRTAEALAKAQGRDVRLARARLLARGEDWRTGLAGLDAEASPSGGARLLRGRLRERAGRFAEAWTDYVEGKATLARESGRRYDAEQVEREFAALSGLPADLPGAGRRPDCPQPIFILGMPRSGTTLTEQVLASHSRIRAGGELPFVAELRDFAERVIGRPFPQALRRLRLAEQRHLPALFRDFYLARAAVYGLSGSGVDFFTDKMPLNDAYAPLIRIAFPHAPVILVERHPLDVLVSIMAHDLTHGFNCGYRLEDAAHHLAAVHRLRRTYLEQGVVAPYRLRYERFVADQAGETARLMAHVGLAAEPAQLRFHELARHAPTPSYAQVRQPINAGSIGRWRPFADRLASARAVVGDAMRDGGYAD